MDWATAATFAGAVLVFMLGLLNLVSTRALYKRFELLAGVRGSLAPGSGAVQQVDFSLDLMAARILDRELQLRARGSWALTLLGLISGASLMIALLAVPGRATMSDGALGFVSSPGWAIWVWASLVVYLLATVGAFVALSVKKTRLETTRKVVVARMRDEEARASESGQSDQAASA